MLATARVLTPPSYHRNARYHRFCMYTLLPRFRQCTACTRSYLPRCITNTVVSVAAVAAPHMDCALLCAPARPPPQHTCCVAAAHIFPAAFGSCAARARTLPPLNTFGSSFRFLRTAACIVRSLRLMYFSSYRTHSILLPAYRSAGTSIRTSACGLPHLVTYACTCWMLRAGARTLRCAFLLFAFRFDLISIRFRLDLDWVWD